MTAILFVTGALLLATVFHYHLVIRPRARDAIFEAYQAVVGLADVAQAAHELSQLEARTAVSMGQGGPSSFINERNPAAQRAKMRGYEVWRNSQIAPTQNRLRAAYNRYEKHTRRLIELVKREQTRGA